MTTPIQPAALFLAALLAGCATVNSEARDETPVAPAPSPAAAAEAPVPPPATAQPAPAPASFDPKAYAAAIPNAKVCEQDARMMQQRNPDAAWAVLRACVEKGNFTLLDKLLDGTWDKDLQTRRDAAPLVAKVVASRGGDVEGDLQLLISHRVPVFSLEAAMKQPATYKGRLLLVRAKVNELKSEGGKPTVALAEIGLGSTSTDVEVGPAYSSSHSSSGSFNAKAKTTRYGSGSVQANSNYSSSSRYATTRKLHENVASETGRELLGRLVKPDPFLEPGKEFVVLARFDGVRVTGEADDDTGETPKIAVISIITYFLPNALLMD